MSKPTDAELNRAMIEALGWYPPTWVAKIDEDALLDYCTDRNLLPEVWLAVGLCFDVYLVELTVLTCGIYAPGYASRNPYGWVEDIMPAAPRQHVIAALKALSKWPADWSTE